jgi:hypothetical protein
VHDLDRVELLGQRPPEDLGELRIIFDAQDSDGRSPPGS